MINRSIGGIALAVLTLCAGVVRAQDPVIPPPPQVQVQDTIDARNDSIIRSRTKGDSIRPRPPITPGQAFLRSLILPGWGQSRLGRHGTAALFVAFEGFSATMVWKATWQLNFARTRGKYVASHKQEQQDWIVLLVFNHLISGAEAYVSAHLWDFPPALSLRTMPDGRTGLVANIRF